MKRKLMMALFAFTNLTTLITGAAARALDERIAEFTTHDGHTIRGKLSYPKSANGQKRPGVLLLHGSGSTDMNLWLPGSVTATGKPTKIFEDIAKALNDAGAVVYRYNKRGVTDSPSGEPTVDKAIRATGTVTNLLKDASRALELLRQDPNVDPARIILLGLSEGTDLAPLLAQQDGKVAALVLMSSAARNLRDTLYYQAVERNMNLVRMFVDTDHDGLLTAKEIAAYPELSLPMKELDRSGDKKISMAELESALLIQFYAGLDADLRSPMGDWLKEHFALPPNYQTVAKFKGPILMLQGEIDVQTPLEETFLIADALRAAGHTRTTVKTFPGLGHGFSHNIGKGGVIPTIGPIDSTPLRALEEWLKKEFP